MPGANEFDMGAAVESIGAGLGFDTDTGADDGNLDLGDGDLGGEGAGSGDGDPGTGADDAGSSDPAGSSGGTPKSGAEADAAALAASNGTPTPAPRPDQAPNTWKPEVAAKWATLDPEVKAEILRREDDMFKGIEGYKSNAKIGEAFNQVIEPYKHILAHFKVDPVQQLSGLMRAHYTLSTAAPQQRVELFRKLASSYGVEVGELAKDPPYVDPEVQRLTESQQALQSQFTQTQQELQAERQRAVQREVDAFEQEKDASGNLKRPYFKELESDIAAQIRAGAKDLQEAYDRAVWANPVTRAKEQQRIQKDAEAQRRAADKAKAEAARKATAANSRTSAKSGSAAAPLGSMDDTLKETLAKIQKRG